MMKNGTSAAAVVLAATAAMVFASGTPAFAHEIRDVGKYQFTVGFGNEPAYLDQQNFMLLLLADRATGTPITDLGDTLKVAVEFGSQSQEFALEPSFDADTGLGTPGEYDAVFFPTAPGTYTFHFTGSIDGQKVDESFTSGPETFSEVEDPSSVQFPTKVPTVGEVGQLVQNQGQRLSAEVSSASDDASSAKTLGLIGIIVGSIGLLTAAGALVVTRRRTRATV